MKIINQNLLLQTSEKARQNERKRVNHNFHDELDNPVHRLLNALEPETYIPPHRHTNPAKEEAILVLSGELLFFSFKDDGSVIEALKMGPDTDNYGVDMKAGEWHSLIPLKSNTVIYEVKAGPFHPLSPEDIAPWAPDINDKEGIALFKKKLIAYYNESVIK